MGIVIIRQIPISGTWSRNVFGQGSLGGLYSNSFVLGTTVGQITEKHQCTHRQMKLAAFMKATKLGSHLNTSKVLAGPVSPQGQRHAGPSLHLVGCQKAKTSAFGESLALIKVPAPHPTGSSLLAWHKLPDTVSGKPDHCLGQLGFFQPRLLEPHPHQHLSSSAFTNFFFLGWNLNQLPSDWKGEKKIRNKGLIRSMEVVPVYH